MGFSIDIQLDHTAIMFNHFKYVRIFTILCFSTANMACWCERKKVCYVSASEKIAFESETRLRWTEDKNHIKHMLNSNNKSI